MRVALDASVRPAPLRRAPGLFVDGHRDAGALERQRGGQAADARADDEDVELLHVSWSWGGD